MSQTNQAACVLDASALLALLHSEPGHEVIEQRLSQSYISSVNWCETVQKVIAKGIDTLDMREGLETLGLEIVPFTVEDADLAAHLWEQTKAMGLSLGDRACLSLGLRMGVPVFTTDRVWSTLAVGVSVDVIR